MEPSKELIVLLNHSKGHATRDADEEFDGLVLAVISIHSLRFSGVFLQFLRFVRDFTGFVDDGGGGFFFNGEEGECRVHFLECGDSGGKGGFHVDGRLVGSEAIDLNLDFLLDNFR